MAPRASIRKMHDLSREELSGLLGIIAGNVLVHYGMWFSETVRRLGLDNAVALEQEAFRTYGPLAMRRLERVICSHPFQTLTDQIAQETEEDLREILENLAKMWVVSDGCWFQAVEAVHGMTVAKEINDECWFNFAAIEAFKIFRFCGLKKDSGLQGLQQALEFRTYAIINSHSSRIESDGSLVLIMDECRVQNSRRKKNLADYPCKSAGMIEYSQFATCIDQRVMTECLYCPPDPLEKDQFCGWRFTIDWPKTVGSIRL